MLQLSEYRDAIQLNVPVPRPTDDTRSTHDLLLTALGGLKNKRYTGESATYLSTDEGLARWLWSELLAAEATELDPITSRAIDSLLWRRMAAAGRVEADTLRRVIDLDPESDYDHADKLILARSNAQELVVDALVTSAQPELTGVYTGGIVNIDAEVHSQAGPALKNDLATIKEIGGFGKAEIADVFITRGYRLPAKYVVHAVRPVVGGDQATPAELDQLYRTYINALDLAAELPDIHSIAFPAMGTHSGGFEVHESAQVALHAINDWLDRHAGNLQTVVLIVRDDQIAEDYQHDLERWIEE